MSLISDFKNSAIELKPTKSQLILFVLSIIGYKVTFRAIELLESGKDLPGYIVLLIGVMIISCVIYCWIKSQPYSDLSDGATTELLLANGASLKLDPRLSDNLNLLNVLSGCLVRKPIPDAEGMVDDDFNVIPNSKQKSSELVEDINKNAAAKDQEIANSLTKSKNFSQQSPLTNSPPLNPEN